MKANIKGKALGSATTSAHVLRAVINAVAGEGEGRRDMVHRIERAALEGLRQPRRKMDAEASDVCDEMMAIIFAALH